MRARNLPRKGIGEHGGMGRFATDQVKQAVVQAGPWYLASSRLSDIYDDMRNGPNPVVEPGSVILGGIGANIAVVGPRKLRRASVMRARHVASCHRVSKGKPHQGLAGLSARGPANRWVRKADLISYGNFKPSIQEKCRHAGKAPCRDRVACYEKGVRRFSRSCQFAFYLGPSAE